MQLELQDLIFGNIFESNEQENNINLLLIIHQQKAQPQIILILFDKMLVIKALNETFLEAHLKELMSLISQIS
jgi:hypothetical protein